MAELSRFYGIVIAVFFRGERGSHNRPHIHAYYSGYFASIAIDDRKILDGKLPPPVRRAVREWMKLHQDELYNAWDAAQSGKLPGRIKPLR